jgi:hypothetical protein
LDKSGIGNVAGDKVDAVAGRESIIDLVTGCRQYVSHERSAPKNPRS